MSRTIVVDNGAGRIKAGFATKDRATVSMSNTLGKIPSQKGGAFLIGDQVDECKYYAGMVQRRPHEQGILVDWDAERLIWDRLFSPSMLDVNDMEERRLFVTEAPLNLPNVQEAFLEVAFEEMGFCDVALAPAAWMAIHNNMSRLMGPPVGGREMPDAMVMVDSGFSFTHAVPVITGKMYMRGIRRMDVGGKVLTNHLKQMISFRQWNMMDEGVLVNHVKETCCFVSTNYDEDMARSKESGKCEYVLPDFVERFQGYIKDTSMGIRDDEEAAPLLRMQVERFQIPEILFSPGDIGIQQAGLAAMVAASIESSPVDIQPLMWSNVVVMGGNSLFPGFRTRLENDLRGLAPGECTVRVLQPDDPIGFALEGGRRLAQQPSGVLDSVTVSRRDWDEEGIRVYKRVETALGM